MISSFQLGYGVGNLKETSTFFFVICVGLLNNEIVHLLQYLQSLHLLYVLIYKCIVCMGCRYIRANVQFLIFFSQHNELFLVFFNDIVQLYITAISI